LIVALTFEAYRCFHLTVSGNFKGVPVCRASMPADIIREHLFISRKLTPLYQKVIHTDSNFPMIYPQILSFYYVICNYSV